MVGRRMAVTEDITSVQSPAVSISQEMTSSAELAVAA